MTLFAKGFREPHYLANLNQAVISSQKGRSARATLGRLKRLNYVWGLQATLEVNLIRKRRAEFLSLERFKRPVAGGLGLLICLSMARLDLRAAEAPPPPLTVSQVVSRMLKLTHDRTQALRAYTSLRTYHLELRGLIHLRADMKVKMTYRYPGDKEFTVLSRSGSSYVYHHVFERLLEAESRTSHPRERRQIAITPENYNFALAGYERDGGNQDYILKITPKVKNKFLFKGRIWVNDQSFSIVRIEGQPSKSLSWWTPKVNFVYDYKKVGQFWFPDSNKTITHVRIFGRSLLTIAYQDYDLTDARPVTPLRALETALGGAWRGRSLLPPHP